MKKKLFTYLGLSIISLFVGFTQVKADGSYYASDYYSTYSTYLTLDTTIVNNLVSYYNTNLSASYDYYIIYYSDNRLTLKATHYNSIYYYSSGSLLVNVNNSNSSNVCDIYYSFNDNTYSYSCGGNSTLPNKLLYSTSSSFVLAGSSSCSANINHNCYDTLQLPSFSNLDYDVSFPQMDIENGDNIPTYLSLTNGQPSADFTQVDMSQYDYIILSLRDYDTSSFNTTIYTLGRLCFTPVYDYGMTPKKDYMTGYQTQGCTEYYNTSTPVSIYIIEADLEYHAVYYIKRYENEANILQIPTSIFDITYITSANVNDPQVTIGGRSYPAIKYSDLTDTANISTETGYISGQVCALGDINCASNVTGIDISDLWTSPLQLFKTVGTSITNVLGVITAFITFLPPTLQAFMYTAFFLVVILGILKILL